MGRDSLFDGIMPLTKQMGEPKKPNPCQVRKLEYEFTESFHLANELQEDVS
jgi:hypothetical protein